jgi:enoyl-CoA hydratase/carnithine racemase
MGDDERGVPMIELETEGDVRILHLREGENRFNRASVDAINAGLDEVEAVQGPVALVTVGDGKFFSNGLDLDWMLADGAADTHFLDDVHAMLERVLRLDMITVAAINGHAFAGGAMLAAAHDFRVMREDRGYWCLPEVDLGLPLTPVMYRVLEAHVPRPVLAEAALTGRRFSGPEALAGGIVTALAPAEALLEQAVAVAAAQAGKDRQVIAAHKRLLHGDVTST